MLRRVHQHGHHRRAPSPNKIVLTSPNDVLVFRKNIFFLRCFISVISAASKRHHFNHLLNHGFWVALLEQGPRGHTSQTWQGCRAMGLSRSPLDVAGCRAMGLSRSSTDSAFSAVSVTPHCASRVLHCLPQAVTRWIFWDQEPEPRNPRPWPSTLPSARVSTTSIPHRGNAQPPRTPTPPTTPGTGGPPLCPQQTLRVH